jgi:Skp family chaperone for outer membrane proteins
MYIMRSLLVFIALLSVASLTGCLPEGKSTGGTAIIDMTKVARSLGRDEAIAERVKQDLFIKQEQLKQLREDLLSKVEDEKEKLGKKPEQEDVEKLNTMILDADKQLRLEIARAEQASQQMQTEQLLRFRDEVEPVARRVASSRGLDTVLIKQQYILVHADAVDITDAVIDELQKLDKAEAN